MLFRAIDNTEGKQTLTFKLDWRQYIVYIGFLAVFILFSITLYEQGFLSVNNLLNIARQTATISIMAVAMTFVIATGEIDLSVGSVTALSAMFSALALVNGLGFFGGIIAGIVTGLIIGGINGLLVTKVGIPSFLVTLGMMGIARGLAMFVTNNNAVPILDDNFNNIFGSGNIGFIPSLLLWTILFLIVGHIVLRKTSFGRQVLATGGNETAARFTGINTDLIKLLVLIVSGFAAGFAGMLYAGRLHAARSTFGEGDELSTIAAVILGGTALSGGTGSIIGSIVGSLMIGTINNGLILMGLNVSEQLIVRGIIIILAVALGKKSNK